MKDWFYLIEDLNLRGRYSFGKKVAPYTRFCVGGESDIFYVPFNREELVFFLEHLPKSIPITTLGNGSNVLVRDGGIRGVLIKLGRAFSSVEIVEEHLIVGAAALNSLVANFCLKQGIQNFSFLSGIPGSVGGGVAMNAGCWGMEFGDFLLEAEVMDRAGRAHVLKKSDFNFGYRRSCVTSDLIVLKAKFLIERGDVVRLKELMNEQLERRSKSQPIYAKTAGSTFKNPPEGKKAWEYIRDVEGAEMRIGDAMWSPIHLNFLINNGNATALQLETLIDQTRDKILSCKGCSLELEVKILGDL